MSRLDRGRSVYTRLLDEAAARRERRKCPPHPTGKAFWQMGDWSSPDRLVCGRCFVTLARRKHEPPARERQN